MVHSEHAQLIFAHLLSGAAREGQPILLREALKKYAEIAIEAASVFQQVQLGKSGS